MDEANEARSFESALEELDLGFSLKFEQKEALKSFVLKKDVFAVLPTGYDWSQMLAYYVQRQFERQLFIPPTGFSSVNGPTPDYTFLCSLACQATKFPLWAEIYFF